MNIACEERKIFDELKQYNDSVIEDGIVDETEYLASKFRIVYILKEANGGKDWSLKKYLHSGGRAQTWDNISRWSEALLNIDNDQNWSYWENNCEERRRIYLKKIGAVNLKKQAGNHTSVSKEISQAALKNKVLLQKQLELYKPNVIVCCGTTADFTEAVYSHKQIDWRMTSRGIWYFIDSGTIVISFLHPEARVKDCILHYSLIDAFKEIMEVNGPLL